MPPPATAHRIAQLLGQIQKGHQPAAAQLQRLGQQHPKNPEVANALGCLALERGEGQQALDAFDRAQRLGYPHRFEQQRNRLIAHALLGDLDGFATHWAPLQDKLPPGERRIELLRSCVRAAQVKRQEAMVQHCLDLWRAEAPEDPKLALTAINVALHRKDAERALALLQAIPPIASSDTESLMLAAQLAYRLKHPAAGHYFDKACATAPTHANQLQSLIALGTNLKRFKETIQLLDSLLLHHPQLASSKLYDRLNVYQQANRWEDVERLVPHYLQAVQRGEIHPTGLFRHLSLPGLSDADHLLLANAFLQGKPLAQPPLARDALVRAPRAGRVLRIGILSADFRNHPVAQLVVEVFERIDRQRFALIGYDLAEEESSLLRTRTLASLDQHIAARDLKDDELVARIRDDAIDVLVDLQGDTAHTRVWLMRQRLAPVQVGWLGFPGGLGQGVNDYILADQDVIPPAAFAHFAEQPVWLPTTYIPNDPQRQPQPCPPRISQDLPETAVVFCCFNGQYKITREIFHAWCRILQQVEDSVLWLRREDADVIEQYRAVAADYGIAPERLIFAPRTQTQVEHLTRLQCADIALDTRPYNAHTTTIDALWARVPVITLPGQSFTSRVAASILRVAGLQDYVAESVDDYVAKAVALARDAQRRQTLRRYLDTLHETSPLYDNQVFVDGLQAAFEAMYARYEAGQPPAPITDLSPWLNRQARPQAAPAERSLALLLEHAETHLHKDQAREALALYEEVLRRDPQQAMALHGMGLSYALLGRYDTALQWLDQALALQPDNKSWQAHHEKVAQKLARNHAEFLNRQLEQAHQLHSQGQWLEAAALYDAILAQSPRHPAALHFKGLLEVQQGDASGLERMRASLRLRPGNEAFLKNYRMAEKLLQAEGDSFTF